MKCSFALQGELEACSSAPPNLTGRQGLSTRHQSLLTEILQISMWMSASELLTMLQVPILCTRGTAISHEMQDATRTV